MFYALASHPAVERTLDLAHAHEVRTKGAVAVFGTLLMFGLLCGGVFMLLQSSFGVKQGYLISGTAFWGSWLVLAMLWLTGVPGLPMPFGIPDVPASTPKYLGPQGVAESWVVLDTAELKAKHPVPKDDLVSVSSDLTDQGLQQQVAAAQTAVGTAVSEHYAEEIGVEVTDITIPGTVVIDRVEVARANRRAEFARVHVKAATPGATATARQREIIGKIEPTSFDLHFDPGNVGGQTYYLLALFFVLFAGHAVLLARYEMNRVPQPQGVPERGREPASV